MTDAYVAPAGTPISLVEIASGFRAGLRGAAIERELEAALREISGRPRAWILSSGRASMMLLLESMRDVEAKRATGRNEVIIPAYTCYSVPAAIERAGLVPRLCDIDPRTLSYDADALARMPTQRAVAIVSSNLYGMPNALPAIEAFAQERGLFLLDDGAQALGASIAGRPVGGFGDVGLYSFDKGKNITTIQGGAIVASPGELGDAVAARCAKLPAPAPAETFSLALKLVAYSILLRPALYGLVRRALSGSLGITPYETTYPVARLGQSLCGVAALLAKRLPRLAATRTENAARYARALADVRAVETLSPLPGATPAWVRYPLLAREAAQRPALIASLDAAGIGATASYPQALPDVPEVARRAANAGDPFPGARSVAARIITLPTHPYCPADIAERVRDLIQPTARGASGVTA
jgi:dTDP-4-amino-4,6-dideoxygalactose transaminase